MKNEIENLKEKLFSSTDSDLKDIQKKYMKESSDFCEDYKKFLDKSKTERETVEFSIKLAEKKGFQKFNPQKKYKPYDKIYYNNRFKSVIFTVIGKNGLKDGGLLEIAHIDSPRLDLKPNPLYENSELAYLRTHYYGGIKKYQWTTIPLSLHGVVIDKDMNTVKVNIGDDDSEPKFCVTDILPHLAKEQMGKNLSKAIMGEDLVALSGSIPESFEKGENLVKLHILKLLNEKYGITEKNFISSELCFVPSQKACDIGLDRGMIGAYGHDDKVCAYPALMAILNAEKPDKTIMTVLTDKEETGSDGNTGLNSNYLMYFIKYLSDTEDLSVQNVFSKSKCLSADVNAAFDPLYASCYETSNSCYLGKGTVITKYTGSGGKYSTSDASAEFVAEIMKLLDSDNIAWQTGELGKVDAGGGGTVAKFVAKLNIDTLDIGVPVLSMHAPFEVVSKFDVFMTYKAFDAFFRQ